MTGSKSDDRMTDRPRPPDAPKPPRPGSISSSARKIARDKSEISSRTSTSSSGAMLRPEKAVKKPSGDSASRTSESKKSDSHRSESLSKRPEKFKSDSSSKQSDRDRTKEDKTRSEKESKPKPKLSEKLKRNAAVAPPVDLNAIFKMAQENSKNTKSALVDRLVMFLVVRNAAFQKTAAPGRWKEKTLHRRKLL